MRSQTGNHILLPSDVKDLFVDAHPRSRFSTWTFQSGTVLWKIWPAVLLHTVFAAIVYTIDLYVINVSFPSVMLTVLGVVIGFVLAYRVSSGYDRYWMGRTYWSDIVRNSRTFGRLLWFHVPLLLTPRSPSQPAVNDAEVEERIMREKRMALDLIEGFAVATKHHLRGESGIYYEDLYHLIKPLHEDKHHHHHEHHHPQRPPLEHSPTRVMSPTPYEPNSAGADPQIPPINSYGTFDPEANIGVPRRNSNSSLASSHQSEPTLLPSSASDKHRSQWGREISSDLIPFMSMLSSIKDFFTGGGGMHLRKPRIGANKHQPEVACETNIPLQILASLSEYVAVLEGRGVVPGTSMGPLVGTIQMFEDSLSGLERILTTPLPFVYSVHIRHTIWIYLFFLPFQLIDQFDWYSIPGVGLAAFFYLGFLAAGEEIEQPFGYDENDLDLDIFIREIVHRDLVALKRTPGPNVRLPQKATRSKRGVADFAHHQLEGVFGEFD